MTAVFVSGSTIDPLEYRHWWWWLTTLLRLKNDAAGGTTRLGEEGEGKVGVQLKPEGTKRTATR